MSIRDLTLHINSYHKNESRVCIFNNCDQVFAPGSISRNHFRLKHFLPGKTLLKEQYKVSICVGESHDISDEMLLEYPIENNTDTSDGINLETTDLSFPEEDVEDSCLKSFADFTNRLLTIQNIPANTIDKICEEYLKQQIESSKERGLKMRDLLTKKAPQLNSQDLEEIIKVSTIDPFLSAQEKLKSTYARKNYIKRNFVHVPGKEIVLNPDDVAMGHPKDCVHYINIKESVRNIIEDESFVASKCLNDSLEFRDDGPISDIKDGRKYKLNPFFRGPDESYALMLYSDAVELCNPIGFARGRNKIVCVYFTLLEIPKYQRSSVKRLQLCAVYKEKLTKKYNYDEILKCLRDDLVDMENGMLIQKPVARSIKVGLALYSGDNLEVHLLCGWSACFNSKDICRHCHCQYPDIEDCIHDFVDGKEGHKMWTKEEYDTIMNFLENPNENTDNGDMETYGLKNRCIFNTLNSFHCVGQTPPDILHDFFEQTVSQDLLGIIRILIAKKVFSIEQYNQALRKYKFSSCEKKDKPEEIPRNPKVEKLRGKGVSHWVHLRNFPLILYQNNWILEDDDSFQLSLLLHEICERLTAEKYEIYEIHYLEELIVNYLNLRVNILKESDLLGRAKPKHHFITHYPRSIFDWGPPTCYWTARFESKHQDIKRITSATRQFTNIGVTIVERHQLKMASNFFNGLFETEFVKLTKKHTLIEDRSSPKFSSIKDFIMNGDISCGELYYKNRKYEAGIVVVISRKDTLEMDCGIIRNIFVRRKQVYFLVTRCLMRRSCLGFFELIKKRNELEIINVDDLHDAYPLEKKGTENYFVIMLHHHVSFKFD